jgi:hypothetical protein
LHQPLGVYFRALECRASARRPDNRPSLLAKQVSQAALERGLWTDDRQIDVFLLGEGQDVGRIEDVDGPDRTEARNTWISWRCNNLRTFWVGQQPPDEGVFAATRPKNENSHAGDCI